MPGPAGKVGAAAELVGHFVVAQRIGGAALGELGAAGEHVAALHVDLVIRLDGVCSEMPALASGDAFGDVAGEGHLEADALVRLHHAHDPQHQGKQSQAPDQQGADAQVRPAAVVPPSEAENGAEHDADDVQASEGDQGLGGVEAHEGTAVDEEEDQPRDPAEHITQQRRRVFRKSGLLSLIHI